MPLIQKGGGRANSYKSHYSAIGESGLGKSTLVNSLYDQQVYPQSELDCKHRMTHCYALPCVLTL